MGLEQVMDAIARASRSLLIVTLVVGLAAALVRVAADIIRTVAVQPSLQNVGLLRLIVVIRTFLSFLLEVEIDGRWPWRRAVLGRAAPSARVAWLPRARRLVSWLSCQIAGSGPARPTRPQIHRTVAVSR